MLERSNLERDIFRHHEYSVLVVMRESIVHRVPGMYRSRRWIVTGFSQRRIAADEAGGGS